MGSWPLCNSAFSSQRHKSACTSHAQLEIEQARFVQQQKRHEANLPALPLEDARARVRQLEVRSKETELAIN